MATLRKLHCLVVRLATTQSLNMGRVPRITHKKSLVKEDNMFIILQIQTLLKTPIAARYSVIPIMEVYIDGTGINTRATKY